MYLLARAKYWITISHNACSGPWINMQNSSTYMFIEVKFPNKNTKLELYEYECNMMLPGVLLTYNF